MAAPAKLEGPGGKDGSRVRVVAFITDHGEAVTGYPAGTMLPWPKAKSLPAGNADGPYLAEWRAYVHGRAKVGPQ